METSSKLDDISVFTPGNEPYLGRETVHALDNLIIACMESNKVIAAYTHKIVKTDMQQAACQLIPQSISIALSIRELIRQGYLFGAFVLVRPLAERAAILLYLQGNPHEIEKWKRGWKHNDAPSLAQMFDVIGSEKFAGTGRDLTRPFNDILHGKPDSAVWSLVAIDEDTLGHGSSKNLSNPVMCDDISLQTAAWLAVIVAMMSAYFPNHTAT